MFDDLKLGIAWFLWGLKLVVILPYFAVRIGWLAMQIWWDNLGSNHE